MASGSRQRLRPWLIAKISSGDIEGLHWIDESQKIFRIPWKHGGKQDWDPKHSQVFMEWARHTGKYREGHDRPEWAKWKTRLRCAFNKAQDIVEIKGKSDTEAAEPFKVYQFTERSTAGTRQAAAAESGRGRRRRRALPGRRPSGPQLALTPTPFSGNSPQAKSTKSPPKKIVKQEPQVKQELPLQPVIPLLDEFNSSKSGELPSDLRDIRSLELVNQDSEAVSITMMSTDSPLASFGDLHVDDHPGAVAVDQVVFATNELTGTPLGAYSPHGAITAISPIDNLPEQYLAFGPPSPLQSNIPLSPSVVSDILATSPSTLPYRLTQAASPLQGDVPGPLPAAVTPVEADTTSFELPPLPDSELIVLHGLPTSTELPLGNIGLQLQSVHEERVPLDAVMRILLSDQKDMPTPIIGHEFCVRIQYLGNTQSEMLWEPQTVYEKWVIAKQGCRLYYGSDSEVRFSTTPEEADEMFGPAEADQIHLPPCDGVVCVGRDPAACKLDNYLRDLLDNIARGVHIECDNGDIYATRHCKCRVYFCNETKTNGVKLQRGQRTKIFDFQNVFRAKYQTYSCSQQGPPPSTEVRLSFGQTSTYQRFSHATYMSAFIISAIAEDMLKEPVPSEQLLREMDEEMQVSEADELDTKYDSFRDCKDILSL